MKYHCHTCGKDNNIVNQCGCDPNNMPTKIEKSQSPSLRQNKEYKTVTVCRLCNTIWIKRPFLCGCQSNCFMKEYEATSEDLLYAENHGFTIKAEEVN